MRVALRRIDGVDSVGVSLDRGLAVIRLTPDNSVTLGRVRDAIRDNGFTPKQAEVQVDGRVVRRPEGLFLEVTEGTSFVLATSDRRVGAALDRAAGGRVSLVGMVPETRRETPGPFRLVVARVLPQP